MAFDWTINVGTLINLIVVSMVGIGLFFRLRYDVDRVGEKVLVLAEGTKEKIIDIESDLRELKLVFSKLTDVLVMTGRQDERITNLVSRMDRQFSDMHNRLTNIEARS